MPLWERALVNEEEKYDNKVEERPIRRTKEDNKAEETYKVEEEKSEWLRKRNKEEEDYELNLIVKDVIPLVIKPLLDEFQSPKLLLQPDLRL